VPRLTDSILNGGITGFEHGFGFVIQFQHRFAEHDDIDGEGSPESGSTVRHCAGIPHLFHEQALCAALVVVTRSYDANNAGVVLA